MQSKEFADTFDRAASIIAAGHKEPGVEHILSDIRTRAFAEVQSPLKNRNVFIEPRVDSQMLGVPEHLYDLVTRELRQFQLMHVWVRANCPVTNDTIVETRKAKKFHRRLSEPCPHCGQSHLDLPSEFIEYFLALNFTLSDRPLNLVELIIRRKPPPKLGKTPENLLRKTLRWIVQATKSLFPKRGDSPVENATAALAENHPAQKPPTTDSITRSLWVASAVSAAVIAIGTSLLVYFDLKWQAAIWFIVLTPTFTILMYFAWWKMCNQYPIVRKMLTGTLLISGFLIAKGACGLKFSLKTYDTELIDGMISFGESDGTQIFYGVCLFAIGVTVSAITYIQELKYKSITPNQFTCSSRSQA